MGRSIIALNAVAIVILLAVGAFGYLGDQRAIADLRQANQYTSDQLKQATDQLRQAQDKLAASNTQNQTLTQQVADANKQIDDTQKKLADAQTRASAAENTNQTLTQQAVEAKKQADDAQSSNKALVQKIDQARVRAQLTADLIKIGADAIAGKDATQESLAWVTNLGKLNDPQLNQMLSALAANPRDPNASSALGMYLSGSVVDSLK